MTGRTRRVRVYEKKETEMSIVDMNARHKQIMAAYWTALDGRDQETVAIGDLLPGIFEAVPDVQIEEIKEALYWAARQTAREADALEQEGQRRFGKRWRE